MKGFSYNDEKVYVVKFTTNYGTFEFDLDFTEDYQQPSAELLQKLRKVTTT